MHDCSCSPLAVGDSGFPHFSQLRENVTAAALSLLPLLQSNCCCFFNSFLSSICWGCGPFPPPVSLLSPSPSQVRSTQSKTPHPTKSDLGRPLCTTSLTFWPCDPRALNTSSYSRAAPCALLRRLRNVPHMYAALTTEYLTQHWRAHFVQNNHMQTQLCGLQIKPNVLFRYQCDPRKV